MQFHLVLVGIEVVHEILCFVEGLHLWHSEFFGEEDNAALREWTRTPICWTKVSIIIGVLPFTASFMWLSFCWISLKRCSQNYSFLSWRNGGSSFLRVPLPFSDFESPYPHSFEPDGGHCQLIDCAPPPWFPLRDEGVDAPLVGDHPGLVVPRGDVGRVWGLVTPHFAGGGDSWLDRGPWVRCLVGGLDSGSGRGFREFSYCLPVAISCCYCKRRGFIWFLLMLHV